MTLFEFSVYLDHQPTDEEQDALYKAGFDDSVVEVAQGRGIIHVARESDSLVDVILSAFNQAKHAGFDIVGIDDEDLVTLKTIASRVGRTYESMRLLASGQRGPGDFPPPLSSHGPSFYSWSAVAVWFETQLDERQQVEEQKRTLAAADHLLRARALVPDLEKLSGLTA